MSDTELGLDELERRCREHHTLDFGDSVEEPVQRLVMDGYAVLPQLIARLRAAEAELTRLREYEAATRETIAWDASGPAEARLLTQLRASEERAEKAEARAAELERELEMTKLARDNARKHVDDLIADRNNWGTRI